MTPDQEHELERAKRTSDMLCTGHAALRDRCRRAALLLDLAILALSTWIVALAFASAEIATRLSPLGCNPTIWIGVLSATTFFLTLVQMKTDLKSKADAHRRTLELYAEVKREARYLLASGEADDGAYRRVLVRYDMASAAGVEIPEKQFLRLKRRHRIKVETSKYLDDHPSASLWLLRIRIWIRDNRAGGKQ
jgi:hypothetical protein